MQSLKQHAVLFTAALVLSTATARRVDTDMINQIFGARQSGYGQNNADLTENSLSDTLIAAISGAPEDQATVEVDKQFTECSSYAGYECVPYYQCHNGSIITDGSGLINIRNGFSTLTPEDSKCEGFLDVCCRDPDYTAPPTKRPVKQDYVPRCGQRNTQGVVARIQGFTESESQFGEWPHMCAVLEESLVGEEEANLYQCGGALIAPGVVLTAAHCVDQYQSTPGKLKIRCGEWDTQGTTEPLPHQDRRVASLQVHPEFQARNLHNDFAILFLEEDFTLAPHIDTICLPRAGEIFDGETCFATGWGKDEFGASGQYQVVLKEIDLPVVNHASCQEKLRTTRLGRRFRLHDSFTCAGGEAGKDTCKGDGGSPLVCPSKYSPNTYVQAGIVAWGVGCGEDGTPGVYASVSQAVCWVDSVLTCHHGELSGDYNSYLGQGSECQDWLEGKLQQLQQQRDRAGKYGRIFQGLMDRYQQCTVNWGLEGEEDYALPSDFAKIKQEKTDSVKVTQPYY